MDKNNKKSEALLYHSKPQPGKIHEFYLAGVLNDIIKPHFFYYFYPFLLYFF
jgi:hypothetical protein